MLWCLAICVCTAKERVSDHLNALHYHLILTWRQLTVGRVRRRRQRAVEASKKSAEALRRRNGSLIFDKQVRSVTVREDSLLGVGSGWVVSRLPPDGGSSDR